MKAPKTVFVCSECGYTTAKWLGRCPTCGAWNTFEEETQAEPETKKASARRSILGDTAPTRVSEIEMPNDIRTDTGIGEFNRVLGGGLVDGSVILLCGEPGIGKSTLLMQMCESLGEDHLVLYVSGEESQGQLKLRAQRLSVDSENLYIMTETDAEKVLTQIDKLKPDVVIVDSIQTMYTEKSTSAPGSVSQVRESAMRFIAKAKSDGTSVILVGHVNKEGSIAGPKVLEHMVDAVLYFEGDRRQSFRIVRAMKNRYGSTNEIGVFEMSDRGLCGIENPSEMLLRGRPVGVSGNCAVSVMEGTRPVLAEIQALVTRSFFPSPRRMSSGIDYNRMALILAVLEKRLGLHFSQNDVYLNVVNGLQIDEPSADIAIVLALISGMQDIPVPDDIIAVGEIGLSGEVRAVSNLSQRIKESERLGFRRMLVPYRNFENDRQDHYGIELIKIKSIFDTLVILKKDKS